MNNDAYTDTLVVDFEHENSEKMEHLLTHLKNLLADFAARDKKIAVAVVAYGAAIMRFIRDDSTDFAAEIAELQAKGVEFYTCQNAMHALNITSEQLLPDVMPTPSGVARIVEAQLEGSVYFKA